MWPQGKIPDGYHQPVTSDVPVLIFSGYMDTVTPPQHGEEVASHLPNSRHVIIPRGGHGTEELTNVECLDKLMLEFLSNGNAKELDITCIEDVLSPPFVTKESNH